MTATTAFMLDGKAFELRPLPLDESCRGLELLATVLGPAFGSASDAQAIALALTKAGELPKLVGLFAKHTRFDRQNDGVMTALAPFVGDVFERRLDLALLFVAHAVKAEYAAFLDTANQAALAETLASVFQPAQTA